MARLTSEASIRRLANPRWLMSSPTSSLCASHGGSAGSAVKKGDLAEEVTGGKHLVDMGLHP
jgi:hypothetical protein